ncbi:DUF2202 domain-containing protein [Labilibaculum antarcticum]|uniref:DUF2202 domain-containing protein n=1 Tax=Labilibaculum antarcticum TaxID=1717717 RepID=A0A1Y1CRW5_9BACT|nr:DUF2202 domain-containing protein [Labilibaculum antarcticum]BAX82672.1 hypothetical protein ALGA_4382 [Labilibaculum antarcticum]
MRNKITKVLIAFTLMLGFVACDNEDAGTDALANLPLVEVAEDGSTDMLAGNLSAVLDPELTTFTDSEQDGLLLMREEELLAHDVYSLFSDLYDVKTFSNITGAESTHAAAVLTLLDLFEIEDPSTGIAGEYQNETLQALYDELSEKGMVSVEEALKVGALIEEVDIADLEELMAETENENILLVYSNLLRGSRNHLRAFVRVLGTYGVDYLPTVLSEDDFNEIINSDTERGTGCLNEYQKNRYGNNN